MMIKTWQTIFLRNSWGPQRFMGFNFLDWVFRVLIGWADKFRSHVRRRFRVERQNPQNKRRMLNKTIRINFDFQTDQHIHFLFSQIFVGNTDSKNVVTQQVKPPFTTRFVRIRSINWSGSIALRVELYGCFVWKHQSLYYLFSSNYHAAFPTI